ncbi:hypothetical protein TCAL_08390 [Tigriopus californicus]|uniref:N-acetyltransferase domain-containing protein n=1 Tax=Tigriopus californicus TaxID=6832 RepID=A0A553PAT5_TIGCA|nr:alpha/beta-tubulin-N-acetyltransferase 9-like [Tigriopus californicus]TRY74793.1 hypothetical protein TCAL_08390 [Tigriopus californicus]|eukprot:TCALIF_08390-PA protein Name:"Similar to NAT9 N-acetyltransferase 9 (Homo sapiens)" AED:0.42 eAED:0.42 QI:0/-1/0/1/-1/1/1/0/206
MRVNWTTQLMGPKVILVPYQGKHVPKYHEWMKSPQLQELTGSEPLDLDEEFAMQKTWRDSPDKCTFIILQKDLGGLENEIQSMVGDTNLFLSTDEDDSTVIKAEAEIMIAEVSARGRKLGWEALTFMLRYGVDQLKVGVFEAKIKMGNEPSIRMFSKLQFQEISRSEVFGEVTLQVSVNENWRTFIHDITSSYQLTSYSGTNESTE